MKFKTASPALASATLLSLVIIFVAQLRAEPERFLNTVSGTGTEIPVGYVPPLLSNGSLNLMLDYKGDMTQQPYCRMTPCIYWQGRRLEQRDFTLLPFGHFSQSIISNGKPLAEPVRWSQTLDVKRAVTVCRNEYDESLSVETTAFVHLEHDLIVVHRKFTAPPDKPIALKAAFHYRFTPSGNENRPPKRTVGRYEIDEKSQCVEFLYDSDAYRPCKGSILLFADLPFKAAVDRQVVSLESEFTAEPGDSVEATYFLVFRDSSDVKDPSASARELLQRCRKDGFTGLLVSHVEAWKKYWDESSVRLPNPLLEKAYDTAQYHLRANSTKWSFPVGIFPTHWAGRFFAWDETFCLQALASSNHLSISRRCPEFRRAGLGIATQRVGHRTHPTSGARYPWETLEDGREGAPPGYWIDHVFHMSNITVSAWLQYLYTSDRGYLEKTAYPVIRECARFFTAHMVYENTDGTVFVGKCTDLERLGPARLNPFMTACGVIYTLENGARAAEILDLDKGERNAWKQTARKLRQNLPEENGRYVPFLGCTDKSIAVLGGQFPYPVLDRNDEAQRKTIYDFVENGRASGNMYPVGNAVCAWYAGWIAAALARLEDRVEPEKFLLEAAEGAGRFGELYEINEKEVSLRPWFSTASGNYVYAVNQMLLQCENDTISVAPAVPTHWKDFSFRLPCYDNMLADVEVAAGKLVRLRLLPGDAKRRNEKIVVLPEHLVDEKSLDRKAVRSVEKNDGRCKITVSIESETDILLTP